MVPGEGVEPSLLAGTGFGITRLPIRHPGKVLIVNYLARMLSVVIQNLKLRCIGFVSGVNKSNL